MLKAMIAAATIGLFAVGPAAAEVTGRHADGFALRVTVPTAASAGDVISALGAIGGWWDGAHTYSGDAANMTMALQPGDCFCEALADGGVVEHGRVVTFDADHRTLDAPLGPLKGQATRAELTLRWPDAGAGTAVTLTYVVEGPNLGGMAGAVDGVLTGAVARLVRYAETGAP